jgi:hypothetical protein
MNNNEDTKQKLEKLKKIEEAYKLNTKRYRDNAIAKGKKQISAIITVSAYEEICKRRKENKLTAGEIIEKALQETTQYLK